MRLRPLVLGLGFLGCTPAQETPTGTAAPALDTGQVSARTASSPKQASTEPDYAWPTGLLSVLPQPFQRFDGSMVFRAVWPQLDNVRFQLAPDDARVAIGIHSVVQESVEGRGRVAAILLSGPRPDSATRNLRLVIAETQLAPPGPLDIIAASAPKAMNVSSEAQFQLVEEDKEWVLSIKDQGKISQHNFFARGPYLMAQPPKKGLGAKAQPKP